MAVLTSLLLAREALKQTWWKTPNQRKNRYDQDPYHWCHQGWARNNYEGSGWGVSHALRPFVEAGDLTGWWLEGRNKADMWMLFTKAINREMHEEIPT